MYEFERKRIDREYRHASSTRTPRRVNGKDRDSERGSGASDTEEEDATTATPSRHDRGAMPACIRPRVHTRVAYSVVCCSLCVYLYIHIHVHSRTRPCTHTLQRSPPRANDHSPQLRQVRDPHRHLRHPPRLGRNRPPVQHAPAGPALPLPPPRRRGSTHRQGSEREAQVLTPVLCCVYVRAHTCACIPECTCVYVCVRTCVCGCVCVRARICAHMFVYIYTRAYHPRPRTRTLCRLCHHAHTRHRSGRAKALFAEDDVRRTTRTCASVGVGGGGSVRDYRHAQRASGHDKVTFRNMARHLRAWASVSEDGGE